MIGCRYIPRCLCRCLHHRFCCLNLSVFKILLIHTVVFFVCISDSVRDCLPLDFLLLSCQQSVRQILQDIRVLDFPGEFLEKTREDTGTVLLSSLCPLETTLPQHSSIGKSRAVLSLIRKDTVPLCLAGQKNRPSVFPSVFPLTVPLCFCAPKRTVPLFAFCLADC